MKKANKSVFSTRASYRKRCDSGGDLGLQASCSGRPAPTSSVGEKVLACHSTVGQSDRSDAISLNQIFMPQPCSCPQPCCMACCCAFLQHRSIVAAPTRTRPSSPSALSTRSSHGEAKGNCPGEAQDEPLPRVCSHDDVARHSCRSGSHCRQHPHHHPRRPGIGLGARHAHAECNSNIFDRLIA